MRPTALLLTLATALAGLTPVHAVSAAPRVVYDNRLPNPEPRLTETERGRIAYLARQAAVQNLWAQGGDVSMDGCAGQDFTVMGAAPGSFTAARTQQTAYLYTYCFNRPGDNQGLVIMQGNTVIAHYVFIDHLYAMWALKDINRNGFTELLLEGGFTGQGYTEGWIQIAELRPTRRLLGQLDYDHAPQPYADNCGTVVSGGTWSSTVVRVVPGQTPTFTQQGIGGTCGNERTARTVGPVKALTLKPAPTGWVSAPIK